jgi:hypothetical protein
VSRAEQLVSANRSTLVDFAEAAFLYRNKVSNSGILSPALGQAKTVAMCTLARSSGAGWQLA